MSQILRYKHQRTTNETHVEFNETVISTLNDHKTDLPEIAVPLDAYQKAFQAEKEAMNPAVKSIYTDEIDDQDVVRDNSAFGLQRTIEAATVHFDVDKRKAANNLSILLGRYRHLTRKTYDEETAAIDDLLREIETAHTADAELLGLGDWTAQLKKENDAFRSLMKARYKEISERPALRMVDARKETDRQYLNVLNYIESLATISAEPAKYDALIAEINSVVERYKNLMAR
jgi:hypothetical protein